MAQIERKKLIDILAGVSLETGVDVSDLIGPKRRALFVRARSLFAQRARLADYTFLDIGEALGGRSHSTVMEYFHDEGGTAMQRAGESPATSQNKKGGSPEMNKEEAKAAIKKFNKSDRKELVAAIADTGTKEERDELAAFFSEHAAAVAEPPTVEAGGADRLAPGQVQPDQGKKKSFLDEIL